MEGVGVVHARYPMPNALSALASAENSKIDGRARMDHRDRFVMNHLQDGEFDALLERMMADEVPVDAMTRVSRAIVTAGTSRPYLAVIYFALVAAHNWRALRERLRREGVPDPMALPSMHRVLDVAETMAEEGAAAGADSPQEARAAVTALRDRLYRPELSGGRRAAAVVYTDEETEESFDLFAAGAAG